MGKFFVALDFLVNLGGPFLVYQLAAGHMSETAALMLSSAPPILWSIGQLIWSRKLDASGGKRENGWPLPPPEKPPANNNAVLTTCATFPWRHVPDCF
jgi:hypothetical protein